MNISPFILLSLTSLFWSLNFIIGKLIVGVIPPITISFLRWGIPLIFYLLYSWKEIRDNQKVYKENWLLILAFGATGYCFNSIAVYEAVMFTSAINTSFINAFNPVLIALTGFLLYRYPITIKQIIGFLLSMAGVIWIIFKGNLALILNLHINIGDLFMVGSILTWSIHTILYKRYAALFHPKSLFTMMMLGGVVITIPLVVVENIVIGSSWITQVKFPHIFGIACLIIFPSVLAYRFWNQALDKVPANKVAIYQYLIPVYTIIISLLFLGESLQQFQVIGGVLIFIGVLLVTTQAVEKRSKGK